MSLNLTYEERDINRARFYTETTPQILLALQANEPLAGWQGVPNGPDEYHPGWIEHLKATDGQYVYFGYNAQSRIEVRGSYGTMPVTDRQWYIQSYSGLTIPTITISAAKNPEQIVKDLLRRFFPVYRLAFAQYLKEWREELNRAQTVLTVAERLAEIAGPIAHLTEAPSWKAKDGSQTLRITAPGLFEYPADLKLSSGNLRLEVNLTQTGAEVILAALRLHVKELDPEHEAVV